MASEGRMPRHTGGCQCGAVRYALYAEPEGVHICHCRMCQKAVGNAFAALAPVQREAFAWTRGTPAYYSSSNLVKRGYCARCGTPLSFEYRDGDEFDVTIGSLDHPERTPPTRQYGIESRVHWIDSIDNLPRAKTEDDMTAERQAQLRVFQHPDHDTDDDWTWDAMSR
ncbi:MAG: GFA family protein [Rhodospirillales bacterium]|nr:GFA family protein [Rhodospirillales bacterium]